VRAESDLQGHHSSETPGCHRCGLPLLADARFCPYCERWLDEGGLQRLLGRRRTAVRPEARRIAGISERLLLTVGLVLFAAVAATSIVLSVVT
jgi:hypothetical protein